MPILGSYTYEYIYIYTYTYLSIYIYIHVEPLVARNRRPLSCSTGRIPRSPKFRDSEFLWPLRLRVRYIHVKTKMRRAVLLGPRVGAHAVRDHVLDVLPNWDPRYVVMI